MRIAQLLSWQGMNLRRRNAPSGRQFPAGWGMRIYGIAGTGNEVAMGIEQDEDGICVNGNNIVLVLFKKAYY